MKVQCISCTSALVSLAAAQATSSYIAAALNKSSTALIADPAGQVYYYNATGNVPSYQQTSPDPAPITPVNR